MADKKIKYSIYPTLLDSFYWYKKMGATQDKFQEIIDKINRVPKEFPIAALKGVQFEECINNMLKGMKLKVNEQNKVETKDFFFDAQIINKVASKLRNAKKQQEYIQGVISTPAGNVKIYGFVDYTYPAMYVDLKTTGSYKVGKYGINNQHKAYPLIAKQNGLNIERFSYLVTDFENMYVEPYEPTPEMFDAFVHDLCEFIQFLEMNRNIIIDTKIFGL